MYWFLYKKYTNHRGLFYNWDKSNLKHTVNPEEAQKRYDSVSHTWKTIKFKRLNNYVDVWVPLWDEWSEDKNFIDYVNKSNVSLSMQQVIHDFLNRFYLTWNWYFKERVRGNSEDQSKIGTLLSMRNMIEWLIRWKPIKVETWVDKATKKAKYSNWYIHQNFWSADKSSAEDLENWVNVPDMFDLDWKQIPIMWAYAQKLLAARFPRPVFDWRRLQLWQQKFLLERWQQTIVLAPREWGKSLIAAYLAFVFLMKQETDYDDEIRWVNIHFFGQTESALDQVAIYVVDMVRKMIDNKKAIRYNKTDMEVIFNDWWVEKKLKLMSGESISKGRWERPTLVIIDEASKIDEEVHKIALGTAGIPIVMITTVNYETKKNRAYDLVLQWLSKQRDYDPIEKTITDLYYKYWLDQVNSVEQLEEMVEDRVFRKMKDDLYAARPLVAMRFTIEDRENITDQQREITIERAALKWEKFLAAEYYSEYIEDVTLFNPDGLFEQTIPKNYDIWFIWYDPAVRYDNAAMVFWWYFQWTLYIENSVILPTDPIEKLKTMRVYFNRYKQRCKKIVLVMDTTQAEAELTLLEERWFEVDIPVMYTKWSWINFKWRMHLVWKKVLVVDVTKEVFFDRSLIRLSTDLVWEWSLSEELQYFTLKQNGKYEASQWKDDQVNAMMLVCYWCYSEVVKNNLWDERFIWYNEEEESYDRWYEMDLNYQEQERQKLRRKSINMGLL